MTLNEDRLALAAAVDAVTGINGYAYQPPILGEGDAWPELMQVDRGPASTWEKSWRVTVVLGGDARTATDRMDALLDQLADALAPVAFVDSLNPTTVKVGGAGDVYALDILCRKE